MQCTVDVNGELYLKHPQPPPAPVSCVAVLDSHYYLPHSPFIHIPSFHLVANLSKMDFIREMEARKQATPIASIANGDRRRTISMSAPTYRSNDAMTTLSLQSTAGETNRISDIEKMTLNTVDHVVDPENLGDSGQSIICPHCRSRHKTLVISSSGSTLYVICSFLKSLFLRIIVIKKSDR